VFDELVVSVRARRWRRIYDMCAQRLGPVIVARAAPMRVIRVDARHPHLGRYEDPRYPGVVTCPEMTVRGSKADQASALPPYRRSMV
jgi:hypothetical protein